MFYMSIILVFLRQDTSGIIENYEGKIKPIIVDGKLVITILFEI